MKTTLNVKDLVSNNQQVNFLRYQDDAFWYITDSGFEFPIPLSDTAGAIFNKKDKAMLFMRWIRKHVNLINDSKQVTFVRYQDNEFWYITESGLEFPVPMNEIQNITINSKDNETVFMKWINQHIQLLETARQEQ